MRGLRGLDGQVRLELLTDRPEDRFRAGAVLHPEGSDEELTIREAFPVADGPGWWLRFEGIADRETAERLRGIYLEIDPPDEPREPGTWYWHEVVGLRARASDGRELGTVREVYRAGGAEVFLVRGPGGDLDIPAVRGIVLELALERGELVVDMDVLALDARPVEDEGYVRPRDRRPRRAPKPRAGPSVAAPGPGPSSTPPPSSPTDDRDA